MRISSKEGGDESILIDLVRFCNCEIKEGAFTSSSGTVFGDGGLKCDLK